MSACDLCDVADGTVEPGGDKDGAAYPSMCGRCRCPRHNGVAVHGACWEECREHPDYCVGCQADEYHSAPAPHRRGCRWARCGRDATVLDVDGTCPTCQRDARDLYDSASQSWGLR